MAIQLNGQEVGPIKFTDDKPGKTIHVGPVTPLNPVDGDVWIDSDALNNAGKNLVQTINLTSGSTKTCAVSSDYKDLEIIIRNLEVSVNATMSIRLNGDSASNYVDSTGTTTTSLFLLDSIKSGITTNQLRIQVADVTATSTSQVGHVQGVYTLASTSLPRLVLNWTGYVPTAAITSVVLALTSGTFVSGTVLVYGVN
jgi:hypothetical protein